MGGRDPACANRAPRDTDVSLSDAWTPSVAGHSPVISFSRVIARVEALGLTSCVITMVEAMLAGCAVLTTGSGGAMEVAALADLPLFPTDDPKRLSQLLTQLATNRTEVFHIARRGQEVALREFSFDRMMDRLRTTLRRLYEDHENKDASFVAGCSCTGIRGGIETNTAADPFDRRTLASGEG